MTRSLVPLLVVVLLLIGGCEGSPAAPPLGDVDLASVTPPETTLEIGEQPWCDPAVAGYWAIGFSDLTVDEIHDWYLSRFTPSAPEATARFNNQPNLREPILIFDDFHVWAGSSGGDERGKSHMWVSTYETTQHDCLPEEAEPWNLTDAWSIPNPCDPNALIVELWGVDYREVTDATPPESWPTMTFDGGRMIAHGFEDLTRIYAIDDPATGWAEYELGGCRLD